jgi:lysophospholipase L1-like esterase
MVALLAAAAIAAHPGPVNGPVVYVGDSLGVGTLPGLVTRMPTVSFDGDARVGRTSTEGLAVLRARLRPRHRVVVFDLGTNDPTPATLSRNLRAARREAGRRELVLFTINKPGDARFNRAIRKFAARDDNAELIDWHARAGSERLLGGDGIHATPWGYRRRIGLVAACLRAPTEARFRAVHAG